MKAISFHVDDLPTWTHLQLNMTTTNWHLRITLESSARQQAVDLAYRERRTPSNYVASLIERANAEKEQESGDKGRTA